MNNKKIISLVLTGTLTAGILTLTPNTEKTVFASELNKVNFEEKINSKDFEEIIKEIENNYLFQKDDGTFYISNLAYEKIDNEILNFLVENMEEINELILTNQLEFKIEKNNEEKQVINTLENFTENTKVRSSGAGRILSSYSYCSNYQWYWWGYKTNVNKSGTAYLQNYAEADALIFGSACGLAATIPGGGPLIAALAAVGGTITYATAIREMKNGILSGKGVRAVGVGNPSSGYLLKVNARY